MSELPRSIYLDLTGIRIAKPGLAPAEAPALRLVDPSPPVAALPTSVVAAPIGKLDRDPEILAVLAATALAGESTDAFHRRKEHLLGALFAALGASEAEALHERLSATSRGDDRVAAQFGRLVVERRERLLAFLADARRREAIENARRPRTGTAR